MKTEQKKNIFKKKIFFLLKSEKLKITYKNNIIRPVNT